MSDEDNFNETNDDREQVTVVVPDLPAELLAETKATFDMFAVDDRMDIRRLFEALRSTGVDATDDDVIAVVEEHDPDGRGYITADQWTAAMAHRWTEHRARRRRFRGLLAAGDVGAATGRVTIEHVREVLDSFDPAALTPVDVKDMLDSTKLGDEGYIDYDEFMATMVRPSRMDLYSI